MGNGQGRWGARPPAGAPIKFTERERQILIGSMLGDGSIALHGRSVTPGYREGHSTKQEAYLRWKADELKRMDPRIIPRSTMVGGKRYYGWYMTTKTAPALHEFMAFYDDKRKVIPQFALDELAPLSLAVWAMDDGYLNLRGNSKSPTFGICSEGFTLDEQSALIDCLYTVLGQCRSWTDPRIVLTKMRGGIGMRIHLNTHASMALAETCAEHWHASMVYKLPRFRKGEAR